MLHSLSRGNSQDSGAAVADPPSPTLHLHRRHSVMSNVGNSFVMKYSSLLLLTLQSATLTLFMRYTRVRSGDMYMATTAVIMAEVFKMTACAVIILFQEGGIRPWLRHMNQNILKQPLDCLKISVPAIIYMLQNNLLYVALSNLEAATFQVTYQLKILTTALFSVSMLRKKLSVMQWVSLVCLFVGVGLVQLQPSTKSASEKVTVEQNSFLGLVSVIIASLMSGFAGIYFEKLLKNTPQSLYLRNVQLGFIGVVFGLITMYFNDGREIAEKGFFYGYDFVVWIVIFLQSFGGILVAVVVKYADNILKGFATSAAIVVACIASIYLFDFHLTLQFTMGTSLVILAVYMYSKFVPVIATKKPVLSA